MDLLAASCDKHECELHAFVLMTNHVHLLITPRIPDGVSLVIRDLGRDYVRTINKIHRRSGTMWEGRFKSSLVHNDSYCLACHRYIELNPVRAGMVQHPADYAWSSFRFNALNEESLYITPHETWLSLGRNDVDRRLTYLSLFDATLDQAKFDDIRFGIQKSLPVGNDRFKQEIENTLSLKLGSGKVGRPKNVLD